MTLTVLLTGFGPFPGAPVNPTASLARRLARRRAATDVRRVAHVFATRYDAVDRELAALIARHRPDAVVMFGLAARRRHISIEAIAHNRISTSFPDAGGGAARRAVIDPGAASGKPGRAPMLRLLAAAKSARVEARLSHDAGRYVCNYLYWRALQAAERPDGPRLAAFVHVPKLRRTQASQVPLRRGYALPDLVRAGEAIVRAVVAAVRASH